ncbi:hypothetical protein EZV62_008357 [Acer yangbiense]|uniref:Retrotransposon gag domain-containing protein n=1 Tax=Acer yangbiense TaxID=1000413 RepID=A0A5C7IDV6_9ROSI|nr:hypothetical protein EZV62_008357 [Acer yangbiense]
MDALEARMVGLEEAISGMQTILSDAVDRLDGLETDYGEITQATKSTIREFQKGFKEDMCFLTQEFRNLRTFVEHELWAIRAKVDDVCTKWASYTSNQTVGFGATSSTSILSVIQVPKPAIYSDDAMKIANAPTFLRDTAQLWWRRKHGDMSKGINPIHTWEEFKKELKRQFYPTNVEKEARGLLRRLKQTGSIRDYVKEFTTLALEIEDMSEKDSLFYFMDGLKDWAKVELERRNVQDLNAVIVEAESLIDYSTQLKEKKSNQGKSEGDKSGQKNQGRKEEGQRKPSNMDKYNKPIGGKSEAPKSKTPCFICDGPHWVQDCPKGKTLNDLMSQHEESQGEGYEASMGSLRRLGALKSNNAPPTSTKKGLTFVNASINGKVVHAILDTRATHNFVSVGEAKKLGLKAINGGGTIKAVNSLAKPIAGIIKAIPFFDIVHAFSFPVGNSFNILDGSKTCMVPAECMAKMEYKTLSALQFKRGMKTDLSFLTTLRELNDGEVPFAPKDPMPAKVQTVLDEYKDVMPQELPKKLSPRREVDHQIELEPGAKPPTITPYHMAPPELEEL